LLQHVQAVTNVFDTFLTRVYSSSNTSERLTGSVIEISVLHYILTNTLIITIFKSLWCLTCDELDVVTNREHTYNFVLRILLRCVLTATNKVFTATCDA